MSDNRQFFPANRTEALALAYTVKMSGADTTPEDFCRKYLDAYARIGSEFHAPSPFCRCCASAACTAPYVRRPPP